MSQQVGYRVRVFSRSAIILSLALALLMLLVSGTATTSAATGRPATPPGQAKRITTTTVLSTTTTTALSTTATTSLSTTTTTTGVEGTNPIPLTWTNPLSPSTPPAGSINVLSAGTGVIGDGTTDDRAAIQSIIDRATLDSTLYPGQTAIQP